MRKLIVWITLLLVLLLAVLGGCQPVAPLNVATVAGSAPAGIAATTAITAAAAMTGTLAEGSGAPGPVHCEVNFEATVRQGPSSGVALAGILDFKVDASGDLGGKLRGPDGSEIPAAGQVDGRAIHLVFDLGDEQTVFGVGAARGEITNDTCGLALGGPFVGPQPGDMGDWLARKVGDNPSSDICGPTSCD